MGKKALQHIPQPHTPPTPSACAIHLWLAFAALLVACAAMQVFASGASACSWPPELPVSIKMEQSDQVFSGRVESIDEYRAKWFSNDREAIVEFRVGKVWKGQAYERMFVKQHRRIPSTSFFAPRDNCNTGGEPSFSNGQRYLVFAQEGITSLGEGVPFSKSYGSAVEDGDIAELGAGVTPDPGTISPVPKANRRPLFWLRSRNTFYAMLAATATLCFSISSVGIYRHMRGQTRY